MVNVNSQGVHDAYKRLSEASLGKHTNNGKCEVQTHDVLTILMALRFTNGKIPEPANNKLKATNP